MNTWDGCLTDEMRKQIHEDKRRYFYKTHCALCQRERDLIQNEWREKHGENSVAIFKNILGDNEAAICPDCKERCKHGAPTEYDKTIEEICTLFGHTYPTRCDNGGYWILDGPLPRDFNFPMPPLSPLDGTGVPKDPDRF